MSTGTPMSRRRARTRSTTTTKSPASMNSSGSCARLPDLVHRLDPLAQRLVTLTGRPLRAAGEVVHLGVRVEGVEPASTSRRFRSAYATPDDVDVRPATSPAQYLRTVTSALRRCRLVLASRRHEADAVALVLADSVVPPAAVLALIVDTDVRIGRCGYRGYVRRQPAGSHASPHAARSGHQRVHRRSPVGTASSQKVGLVVGS